MLTGEVEEWTGLRSVPCGASVRLGLDCGDGLAVRVPGGWVLGAVDRILRHLCGTVSRENDKTKAAHHRW